MAHSGSDPIFRLTPNRIRRSHVLFLCPFAVALTVNADQAFGENAPPPAAGKFVFFEKRIRPVLVKNCYECHSRTAKRIRGGLLVDTRAGLRKGGESGPAVVPKNIKKSLLIGAIKHENFEMPPKGRLPKNVVADFVKWVNDGAPDPREGKATPAKKNVINIEQGRKFWAFQPVKSPLPPQVKNAKWPRSAIDRFVLHRLEQRGLTPVIDADRRTLIRRLTFDLTGLPPSIAEIATFLADKSESAFERVVDRLLASPHFGEHWGRHWLDVARYADSNGGDINLTFRNAWRYRDYVIRSFNADKPFNRFIVEHLAGDLMDSATQNNIESNAQRNRRADRLIATGFLVLGPKMLSERDKEKLRMDVIDEQIDTIGRTFLGLTLGCARCHDHKFDPISTREYYALAGIFRSTVTVQGIRMNNVNVSGWIERPLPVSAARKMELAAYQTQLDRLSRKIATVNAKLGRSKTSTVVAAAKLPGIVVDDVDAKLVGNWKKSVFQKRYVGAGYVHDEKKEKGKKSITFTPNLPTAGKYEVRIAYAGGNGRARKVPVEVQSADGMKTVYVDQFRQPRIGGLFHSLGTFRFAVGRNGFVRISNKGTSEFVIADAVQFLRADGTSTAKAHRGDQVHTASLEKQRAELMHRLADLKKQAPKPAPTYVFKNTNYDNSRQTYRIGDNRNGFHRFTFSSSNQPLTTTTFAGLGHWHMG
ncbi:MAG: DUF1549 domain-containing protein, partial [Planctomycetes bacterium]|nr:DUF1549 domain-containing protein [Planctomycetota bacterium]